MKLTSNLKLDRRDRLILRELDANSRQSYVALGKKLSIPAESVRYRIQRLVSSGVIKNYITVIDGSKLDYYYYKVFLKLHNVHERQISELISSLAENPKICWVIRADEVFDIGFTPRVGNPVEQCQLMDALRQKYSKYILTWTLSVNISMDFLTRDYLTNTRRTRSSAGSYSARISKEQLAPIDTHDRAIIDALSRNSRASATEIAKGVSLSVDSILDRIKALEKRKIIVRYNFLLDNNAIGQVNYYVLIYLNQVTARREAEFVAFCRQEPNIVYLIKSLGSWDYELSVEAAHIDTYRDLMQRLNFEFSDIIQQSTGMLVRKIHKYVYP